jgi:hypothetical protein
MQPEIALTLIGRLLTWETRLLADGRGALWVGWLRHPAYGLLGIYMPPKAQAYYPPPPARRWVQVTGLLQPLRVLAHPGADPRSEVATAETPLLLHAISIAPCVRATSLPAPARQLIHVGPGRWIGRGYLAPARHFADISCFTPTSPAGPATMLAWERPYGVVRAAGSRRYLRYVLTASAGPAGDSVERAVN